LKLLWILILVAVSAAALFVGSTDITQFRTDEVQRDILLNMRAPRVVFAGLTGAMLGLSGSVYQLVLRNPLADSFTTGAASSAALGAVIAIALGLPAHLASPVALFTGLGGLMLVYSVSYRRSGISPITMILAGVVLNIVASSVIGFVKFFFEESLTSIVFWLMGGFYMITWAKTAFAASVLILCTAYFVFRARPLNILALDEMSAETSGVNVRSERMRAFVFSTALVAVSVSFTGLIGFVGLIVPHIARSFYGSDVRQGIFYSSVFGALLMITADAVARTVIPNGAELPVGIVTAVLGGMFFFYILRSRQAEIWHD
jgi:iron complex transport system permease protein